MKKLFLTIMVVAGFVLASCSGNGLSNKSGDVSFSISADEVGRYIAASRESGATDSESIVFEIVAQIQGSTDYYAWIRKQAVYTPNNQHVTTVYGGEIPDDVKANFEKELVFNFKNIPAKQTYKVMIDILIKDNSLRLNDVTTTEDTVYWKTCFSGTQENISVIPGASKPVTVELEHMDPDVPNDFEIQITYNKNGTEQTEILPAFIRYDDEKYKFGKNVAASGNEEVKVWFSKAGSVWYEITGLKLMFNDDTHFFKNKSFILYETDYSSADSGEEIPEKTKLAESSSGMIDLLPLYTSQGKGDDYQSLSIEWKFEDLNLRNYCLVPFSNTWSNFDSFNNDSTDLYSDNTYKFTKDESVTEHNRYRLTIPLEKILGTTELKKGDSIAFITQNISIIGSDGNTVTFENEIMKLGYQLQKNGWESLTPAQKDSNNITIDFNKLEHTLILATNFIDGDEKYLQLYVDLDSGLSDFDLTTRVSISYRVFPAEDKVYILHSTLDSVDRTGIATYRMEMNVKLNESLKKIGRKPAEGNTLNVAIGGNVSQLTSQSKELPVNHSFTSEFYDNAGYKESEDGPVSWYHPLSNTQTEGVVNRIQNAVKEDGSLDSFIFGSIKAPHVKQDSDEYFTDNDFRFQCYTTYASSERFLYIIENFSITPSLSGTNTATWDID